MRKSTDSFIMVFDPTVVGIAGTPCPFFYERVGDDHYYLRGVSRRDSVYERRYAADSREGWWQAAIAVGAHTRSRARCNPLRHDMARADPEQKTNFGVSPIRHEGSAFQMALKVCWASLALFGASHFLLWL